jgi:hypothetical protein
VDELARRVEVIVATAQMKQVPLLTKDRTLHDFAGIECVW